MTSSSTLLSISNLTVALPPGADRPYALKNVSFDVPRGQTVCVVGESGSGKSMMASTVTGLLAPNIEASSGSIELDGIDLLKLSPQAMRKIRGQQIGMIFQDPMTGLNPLKRVGVQISEMFSLHRKMSRADMRNAVLKRLADVKIPDPEMAFMAYPHQLSGGQRQRIMIAMALALDPVLLIADEPTTALDVTTQAQILKLLRELQSANGAGIIFITHDFGVVREIADQIVVLKDGEVVEAGPAARVLAAPEHEYTRLLIKAVPRMVPPPPRPIETGSTAIKVTGLSKKYGSRGIFGKGRVVHALNDVSFSVASGRSLGIVGESGSGKSTLARTLVRLLEPDQGSVVIDDVDFTKLTPSELRRKAGVVQMVFQDPYASLNPRRTVGDLVSQPMIIHGTDRNAARAKAIELLALVGLDPKAMERFPHEFSGGQRQRVGIARALALQPRILVADEAVSALDVSVQAQVLKLLIELRDKLNLTIIFITHDLRVTAQVCDDTVVMQNGAIAEYGPTAQIFANPQHEYTRRLLASAPGDVDIL